VDELLDHPAAGGSGFLLDGQTIVLEDYLAIRPERASEIAAALRDGKLEAGPWYVLADELIPSGEGLVRNLLAGRRNMRALRAESPAVLYCPDSFGHAAALPMIARGFGCDVLLLWRGFGSRRFPEANVFWWIAPDGDRLLTYHLTRSGYELGANLPTDEVSAVARWKQIRVQLAERATTDASLLLNGADHHARQKHREAAVQLLSRVANADRVSSATLTGFAAALIDAAARARIPDVRGELRDSYGFTWTLQGTLASRIPQKRRYVRAERELLRDVEPWAALTTFAGQKSRAHLVNAAWKSLLQCQPHDTLCGCSIDDVARAMDDRLIGVGAQSVGLREDAIHAWLGHDDEAIRGRREEWTPALIVRNRAARSRSGVAIVEIVSTLGDVPVGPGSTHVRFDRTRLPRTPRLQGLGTPQVLSRRLDHDRIESPRSYPDNDAVQRLQAAVWIDAAPAYGLLSIPFAQGRTRASGAHGGEQVQCDAGVISNGRVTLRYDDEGSVALEHDGRVVRPLVEWESRRDRGDLYTPAIREAKLTPRLLNTRLVHRGPWRASVEQRWRLRDRENRIDVRLRFVLDAGAHLVRIQLAGMNAARDHRLRLKVRTDVAGAAIVADAAFGPVQRDPFTLDQTESAMEEQVPTAPLHRYVSLFNETNGATLFADGLTEYECLNETIAVTVLRSVGELSRSDITERPGHAGWPAATPEAQCLGRFEAELALMLHGPRSAVVVDEIERAADDVLFPLTGTTLRNAVAHHPPQHGASLEGAGLALSCIKESEDGRFLVLRCVNLLEQEIAGTWRLDRSIREAHLARLDETALSPLVADGDQVRFLAPARGVVTLLLR
jgi:mannosylglycerate hydrolase